MEWFKTVVTAWTMLVAASFAVINAAFYVINGYRDEATIGDRWHIFVYSELIAIFAVAVTLVAFILQITKMVRR